MACSYITLAITAVTIQYQVQGLLQTYTDVSAALTIDYEISQI